MNMLLCVAVLLAGALAAPSIDSEKQINDALTEANMGLSMSAVAMVSHVEKRDVCDGMKAGMCMTRSVDILLTLSTRATCRMRAWMVYRVKRCVRINGCKNNEETKNAMNAEIQRYDQAIGITC